MADRAGKEAVAEGGGGAIHRGGAVVRFGSPSSSAASEGRVVRIICTSRFVTRACSADVRFERELCYVACSIEMRFEHGQEQELAQQQEQQQAQAQVQEEQAQEQEHEQEH